MFITPLLQDLAHLTCRKGGRCSLFLESPQPRHQYGSRRNFCSQKGNSTTFSTFDAWGSPIDRSAPSHPTMNPLVWCYPAKGSRGRGMTRASLAENLAQRQEAHHASARSSLTALPFQLHRRTACPCLGDCTNHPPQSLGANARPELWTQWSHGLHHLIDMAQAGTTVPCGS
jgi:hypothetical protein